MIRAATLSVLALLAAGCAATDETETVTVVETQTRAAPLQRGDGDGDGSFDEIPEIVDRVEPSVVAIRYPGGEGSGVIWDENGHIVTNNHVIAASDGSVEVVLASGERIDGEVRATDERTDLAVLVVDRRDLPPATFAQELPEVGELAIAMGNPLGFEQSVTAGIVSGLHRSLPPEADTQLVDLIQTDAAISPGNSGGALVDGDGRVIGINVAYLPPQSGAVALGFAIPAPTVRDVVGQLIAEGRVRHAFLGVSLQEVTPEIAQQLGVEEEGAVVIDVQPGSAATRAGLRPGDVIVEFADERVRTVEDLLAELRRHNPGDRVSIAYQRDGDRREVQVRLDERAADTG